MIKRDDQDKKFSIGKLLSDTKILIFGSWAFGAMLLFLGAILIDRINYDLRRDRYIGVLLLLVMPCFILGAVIVVIRKEMPRLGLPSIKGKPAVLEGLVGVVFFSLIEIWLIFFVLSLW